MDMIFQIDKVSGGYRNERIIQGVSLEIPRGVFFGIIGPNGSGKTTLLRMASRIVLLQQGYIRLEGEDIRQIPLREFARQVAFVTQESSSPFSYPVFETVLMGRIPHLRRLQHESKADFAAVEEAMEMTQTTHLRGARCDELSAGERQRVGIARALAQQPKLLFLDEPTAHLDIGHQIQVLDLLKRLNRDRGLTIVMVVHDLNLASAYCTEICLLHEGKVYAHGAPEVVLDYRIIEAVYKTVVVVNKNPLNGTPFVVLVPQEAAHPAIRTLA